MKHQVIAIIALLIAAASLTGCATKSDAERCKDNGGVWKLDQCETEAK
jgi:hypothetical protein